MMPHLAEEIHVAAASGRHAAGGRSAVAGGGRRRWLAAETVTIAVQVMGKLRGTIEVPPGRGGSRR